jgi:hypothetical protein
MVHFDFLGGFFGLRFLQSSVAMPYGIVDGKTKAACFDRVKACGFLL